MVGVIDGFKYIVQCLQDNEFDAVKQCFVDEVYQHIKQLKTSLLKDCELNRVNAYIYNVRVDRERVDLEKLYQQQQQEQQQEMSQQQLMANTPVDLYFDVKYFCEFVNGDDNHQHKIIDILWHAKYEPVQGERLKYEITTPWVINHITVSVIKS